LTHRLRARLACALTLVCAVVWVSVGSAAGFTITDAPGDFTCQNSDPTLTWSYIAAGPSDYIIGNCPNGATLARASHSNPDAQGNPWSGGFIDYADYNNCGWIRDDWLPFSSNPTVSHTRCRGTVQNESTFARTINCPRGTCGNGTNVYSRTSCQEYANAKPWASSDLRLDPIGAPVGSGHPFNWRYLVRRGKMVQVQDPLPQGRQATWVFVPRSCLGTSLPPYQNNRANYVFPCNGSDSCGPSTIGVFRNGDWFLRNTNTSGAADVSFDYNTANAVPLVGDWDGDGRPGVAVHSGNDWYLRNSQSAGAADVSFSFGDPTDIPVVGDWDGNGTTTIGVYRPSQQTWYLRNSNSAGPPDISFSYGLPDDTPVTGDWDGDGVTTVGVFRGNEWHLRNSNSSGPEDYGFSFGLPGDLPVTGDWNGDGTTTVGVFRTAGGTNNWYLSDTLDGNGPDLSFGYGQAGDKPVAGNWDGRGVKPY
jgi:hypothetical protein